MASDGTSTTMTTDEPERFSRVNALSVPSLAVVHVFIDQSIALSLKINSQQQNHLVFAKHSPLLRPVSMPSNDQSSFSGPKIHVIQIPIATWKKTRHELLVPRTVETRTAPIKAPMTKLLDGGHIAHNSW